MGPKYKILFQIDDIINHIKNSKSNKNNTINNNKKVI